MSIYGYSKRQVNGYGLTELSEISLQLPAVDLHRIADFLAHCADEVESGIWRTNHRHLTSFHPEWRDRYPDLDVIVLHPSPDPPARIID